MFNRLFGKKPAQPERETPKATAQQAANQNSNTGGPKPPPSNPAETIHSLDTQLTLLDMRTEKLQKHIDDEVEKAKVFLAADKRPMALQCMKRKKMYEEQVQQLYAQRANIEQMKFALETAALNAELVRAQRAAGAEMTRLNGGMNADRIDEDLEKVREAMEDAKEVGRMLGEPVGTTYDEEDLEGELADLMATDATPVAAVSTGPVKQTGQPLPVLPAVPTGAVGVPQPPAKVPAAQQYSEEDERLLAELNA